MEKRLFLIGDIHNNIPFLIKRVLNEDVSNSILIQVGDFGIGFPTIKWELYDQTYRGLNNILEKKNSVLYVVRGNHDNPQYFIDAFEYSHIKFVKDYSVLELCGMNILCVGGGVSINRVALIRDCEYFNDETFKLDIPKINSFRNIDMVVTHIAPNFIEIDKDDPSYLVKMWAEYDDKLIDDTRKERADATELFNKLKKNNDLKWWFCGHYHKRISERINGMLFRCLGSEEIYNLIR